MPDLTDQQKENLNDLRTTLRASLNNAQALTLSFDDDDSRGDDFYAGVEISIETAIDEIESILSEAKDA